MPPGIRRIGASDFPLGDRRRYISATDCLSEPELLKAYCTSHRDAVCLGGYGYMGCRPEGRKKEEFIKYDFERGCYLRSDGTAVPTDDTYCGRKIPRRRWNGREITENRIWTLAHLGQPDLIDGDLVIEAKGGLPALSKLHTALGQLMMYREHEPNFRYGFLFPAVWKDAVNLEESLGVFTKHGFLLIPLEGTS